MPPDGIQTHDLSRRAAADLRLRPCGQWDRPFYITLEKGAIKDFNYDTCFFHLKIKCILPHLIQEVPFI